MIQTQIFGEKKFDIDVLVVEELHKPVSSLIFGHNCGSSCDACSATCAAHSADRVKSIASSGIRTVVMPPFLNHSKSIFSTVCFNVSHRFKQLQCVSCRMTSNFMPRHSRAATCSSSYI